MRAEIPSVSLQKEMKFYVILYYIIWHKKIVSDTAREEKSKNDKSYFILFYVPYLN